MRIGRPTSRISPSDVYGWKLHASMTSERSSPERLSDDIHRIQNGRIEYDRACHCSDANSGWERSFDGLCARRLIRDLKFNFSELLPSRPPKTLKFPEAKAVTVSLIRRQFYRDIATPSLVELLSESLRCLESFSGENWRIVKKTARRTGDARYAPTQGYTKPRVNYLLRSALSTSLKRLDLFENFHPYLHGEKDTR